MRLQDKLQEIAHHVDCLLEQIFSERSEKSRIVAAMHYASVKQGKRLRPFFVCESAGIFGVPIKKTLWTAAALECVHCYSLVHDDLPAMDNDAFRRGRPTCHKAFDEATAILAGDGLLTLAFSMLSDVRAHSDPVTRCALISCLAHASGYLGMVGGQMLDLEAEKKPPETLEGVLAIQTLKTGALFECALESGALLGQASAREKEALVFYAEKVGLAFQIADDLLDVVSSQEVLGKATQKDKNAGKVTFIDFLGLEGARLEAQRLVEEAQEALSLFGDRATLLKEAACFVVKRDS